MYEANDEIISQTWLKFFQMTQLLILNSCRIFELLGLAVILVEIFEGQNIETEKWTSKWIDKQKDFIQPFKTQLVIHNNFNTF